MQAIIGCSFEEKPGKWFVQLRTPALHLFDQVVLATVADAPSLQDGIDRAMANAGVDMILDWDRAQYPVAASPTEPMLDLFSLVPKPVASLGVLAAIQHCREEIDRLTGVLQLLNEI